MCCIIGVRVKSTYFSYNACNNVKPITFPLRDYLFSSPPLPKGEYLFHLSPDFKLGIPEPKATKLPLCYTPLTIGIVILNTSINAIKGGLVPINESRAPNYKKNLVRLG